MGYKHFNIMMVVILFLAGCMSQQGQGQNPNRPLDDEIDENHIIQVRDSEIEQNRDHTNGEAAERLAEIAANVQGVEDATALVFGAYTVVGVDVSGELERSRVGTVKYSVAEAIKDDPYGHYAFVIADGDVTDRINEINRGIQQGQGTHSVINEIANLVGRYIPETPPTERQEGPEYEERFDDDQPDDTPQQTEYN
ncbi:YhcN/YlaJ family sporulation lipoprotein [Alkalibacillus aidingensis]|uniref:YhcN/YlaJ family sporulation lipoprotein n=1 Tax=Alkalibacillus aidingensis TaxID=2747607 RepID=UPI00166011BC|nr:YhcN/YlaJ family sporulation lipoprotein [Alkalibacillus aidingensis]